MKNFLDISGLVRFLTNWYNLIFGFDQEGKIIQNDLPLGLLVEKSFTIQNMNPQDGFISYSLFDAPRNFFTVVPEKTSLVISIRETSDSFIVNDFGTYDVRYNPDNYISIYTDGQGNICFYTSGFTTAVTINGILTVRYIRE